MPRIVQDELFEAVQRMSRDHSRFSPRRAEPGRWLLRGLVKCGRCGVGVSCHTMRGGKDTWNRYYRCSYRDPLRAGGMDRRCPERSIRADELDAYVFECVREVLQRPAVLLVGEIAVSTRAPAPDDDLLEKQLRALDRKCESAAAERRRLVDLYQADLINLVELQRRVRELGARKQAVEDQRAARRWCNRGRRWRRAIAYARASARSPDAWWRPWTRWTSRDGSA